MPLSSTPALPRVNYSPYSPPEPVERTGVLGPAFRLENDVLNIIDYFSAPEFEREEGFDYRARAMASPFFMNNPRSFAGVQSSAEWDWMEQKLAKEFKDRAAIEAGGIGGIAAAMLAGILSPTVLIPFGSAATASSVLVGAGRAAGWSAIGVGVQEGLLHVNQETRTTQESAFAVGAGVVLGGILGGAIRYLDPLDIDRIGKDMVASPNNQAIFPLATPSAGGNPRGLSAQAAGAEDLEAFVPTDDPGGIAPAFGMQKALSRLNSTTRGLSSEFSGRRKMTAEFSTGGFYTEGALRGDVAAVDGVLEHVIGRYEGMYATSHMEVQDLYKQWYLKTGGRFGAFGSNFAIRSMKEFSELIGQDLQFRVMGRTSEFPEEVKKASDIYFNKVFLPTIREAHYAGLPPFGRLSEDLALRMVTQKVSRFKVGDDFQQVKQIIQENALEQLRQAQLKSEELASEALRKSIVHMSQKKGGPGLNDQVKLRLADLDDDDLKELADLISDELMQKHLSNGLRHGAIDILREVGEKEAKYVYIDPTRKWANGRTWGEFLEQDIEVLGKTFVRSMGADIELYRRFKYNFRSDDEFDLNKKGIREIPQVKEFMDEVKAAREAAAELPEKERKARNKAIAEEEAQFVIDMNVNIQRLRSTRGQPEDPTAIGHRLAKTALQLNTLRLMGTVLLSSLPDLGRPVLKFGFQAMLRDGFGTMARDFNNFKLLTKEAQNAGAGLDVVLHSRSIALAGIFEEMDYHGSAIERGLQYGTSRMGIVAGFDYWTAGMKHLTSAMVNSELMRVAEKAVAKTQLSPKEIRFLGSLNIKPDDARAIGELVQGGGGARMANGAWLPNTEDWTNVSDDVWKAAAKPAFDAYKRKFPKGRKKIDDFKKDVIGNILGERQRLQRVYRSALKQAIEDTIITPRLDRPNWMDGSNLGKLIGQFRSWTLSSTTRMVLAATQDARVGNMAPVLTGVMFSLALGTLSYYTWAMSVGGDTRTKMLNELEDAMNGDERAIRRWMDEAVIRSGLIGVLGEAQKFAERTPGLAKFATFAGEPPTRSPGLNPVEEMIGPWVGLLQNAGRVVATLDDPTSETFRKAKQLMPYQNVFYLRQGFDALMQSAMDTAGVSSR